MNKTMTRRKEKQGTCSAKTEDWLDVRASTLRGRGGRRGLFRPSGGMLKGRRREEGGERKEESVMVVVWGRDFFFSFFPVLEERFKWDGYLGADPCFR